MGAWCGSVSGAVAAVAASALFSLPMPSWAESEAGSLAGHVSGEGGAPVLGARVTARNVQSGRERSVTSDTSGAYAFQGLDAGLYDLTAEITGFVTEVRHGVAVPSTSAVDFTLRLLTLQELMSIQVKSASKIDQRAHEAPSVVSVVTAEDVDRYGWPSLNAILYKQPGFGPAQDYDRHTVASRGAFEGWNNNHLLHLVDGIPFNDNLYGSALTWEITPLFMSKTIEVLRGPGSALYGSNAVNGVVQVNTLSATDLDGRGEARARVGDNGVRVYEVVAGHGAGNLVSGVVGYNAYKTDGNEDMGFDGSGRRNQAGDVEAFRTNDHRNSSYFWAKLEGGKALRGLMLQYHDQYWKFQSGHGWLWWIPDYREQMAESRRILSLSYRPEAAGRLAQEYLVRYQSHDIGYDTRYYPNDAFDGFYPAGMWEHLNTKADDVFARCQFTLKLPRDSSLLVGVEGDRFSYGGDREHASSVDVDDAAGGYPPFAENRTTRLGPWLDYIAGQPILNVGIYGQYSARRRLQNHLNVTVGARYDRISFDFRDIRLADRPLQSKSFSRFSPRVAVVVLPSDAVSIKLLVGRAFRAPSPIELAGAHTFFVFSNIDRLKPEVITTGEAATDWIVSDSVNVRGNVFLTKFENQIAYSAANKSLSTNLYTLKTAGFEAEALARRGGLSAFLNYSYAKRLDEKINDPTIAPSPDHLAWDPAHKVNFGVSYARRDWTVALDGHVQGSVGRRSSEVGVQTIALSVVSLDLDRFRPRTLNGWFTLDGNASYRLTKSLVVGVVGTNLTGTKSNKLVKVQAFPFDYQQEGRRVQASLKLSY